MYHLIWFFLHKIILSFICTFHLIWNFYWNAKCFQWDKKIHRQKLSIFTATKKHVHYYIDYLFDNQIPGKTMNRPKLPPTLFKEAKNWDMRILQQFFAATLGLNYFRMIWTLVHKIACKYVPNFKWLYAGPFLR